MSKIIHSPLEPNFEISDKDVKEAMQEIPGFIDITPGDFVELYKVALVHALRRLRRILRAKEIMTTRVLTVLPGTPLAEVASLMAAEKISGLPVVDENSHPVGMISESDFLTRMASESHAGFMGVIALCLAGKQCLATPVRGQTAADIMSTPPLTVREELTVAEVAELIEKAEVDRLSVVSAEGNLVGIISRTDLVRAHIK